MSVPKMYTVIGTVPSENITASVTVTAAAAAPG